MFDAQATLPKSGPQRNLVPLFVDIQDFRSKQFAAGRVQGFFEPFQGQRLWQVGYLDRDLNSHIK